jgi:peptide-methionine (R)-S-oxide reductase
MSETEPDANSDKVVKSDAAWRRELTAEQYYVLRQHGTERPGTSPLNREKRKGQFQCAGCGAALFTSDAKFESGTGWPSFDRPSGPRTVSEHEDASLFMRRTEVRCARCDGHLGHVFPDGPRETTGLRYCINGAALKFKPGDT